MSQVFGSALTLTSAGRQGYTIVRQGSQLVRLRYFDGKFLRAADLELEQRYTQTLIQLSNQAGGPGIVHGFSTVLGDGDTLLVGEGLGIEGGYTRLQGTGADSLSVCPTVRLGYRSSDSGSTLSVPIGVGLGTSISVTSSCLK